MSDSVWTRRVGADPSWKHTKVMELTGAQLATAVRSGVLQAAGVLALLSFLTWLVVAFIQAS